MNKKQTCCFTGQRELPGYDMEHILERFDCVVDKLTSRGVHTFISGGELGFDQLAASLIIAKKDAGHNVRLVFALCKNQDENWDAQNKKLFCTLLSKADDVVYVSNVHSSADTRKRNCYMIDISSYCITTRTTGQAAEYAKQNGVQMINILEEFALA